MIITTKGWKKSRESQTWRDWTGITDLYKALSNQNYIEVSRFFQPLIFYLIFIICPGKEGGVSGGAHSLWVEQGGVPVPGAAPHPGLGRPGQAQPPRRGGEVPSRQYVRLRHRVLRPHCQAVRQQPCVRLILSSNKLCEIYKQIIAMTFKSPQRQHHITVFLLQNVTKVFSCLVCYFDITIPGN